jgi:hypothetical protein
MSETIKELRLLKNQLNSIEEKINRLLDLHQDTELKIIQHTDHTDEITELINFIHTLRNPNYMFEEIDAKIKIEEFGIWITGRHLYNLYTSFSDKPITETLFGRILKNNLKLKWTKTQSVWYFIDKIDILTVKQTG